MSFKRSFVKIRILKDGACAVPSRLVGIRARIGTDRLGGDDIV